MTVSNIVDPLVIVEKIEDVKYGELVEIETGEGILRRGTVLDVSTERAVVQVFEGTLGLDVDKSRVRFLGRSQQPGKRFQAEEAIPATFTPTWPRCMKEQEGSKGKRARLLSSPS